MILHILLTTTSYPDAPGAHQDLLESFGTGELCGAMALAMARAGAEVVGKSGECQILDSAYAAMTI